ncbi:hypothetical protein SUGI_0971300 [Cryptomeria japonica]|uniref:homeobox-leucine zipper protein HOX4 n=1 Tax=Cryptomeria japonica TaxID=3369 RepID=UPI0024147166|nr:homeobox-leucine zipper protein HOX4 [Cryptomeria japonica]GLJ46114.1 hypothetical protein SUGI_0971300 [Cryptomeria japonica]
MMAWNARRPCLDPNYILMQPNGGRSGSRDGLFSVLDSYPFPSLRGLQDTRPSGFLGKRPYFSMFDHQEDEMDDKMFDSSSSQLHHGDKKRRLSIEQVRSLEKCFEAENKLEPDRKIKLAQELGLQPRQVAVWFQNRRARWKTKQLERDNDDLKESYDAVMAENQKLKTEVAGLRAELEACKNNGKDVVLKSVKSESETEATEPSQTVQSESESEEMSKKLGKDNFSTCSEVSIDQIGDTGTPQEQASGGGIDGDNASSAQDVSTMGSYYINFTENQQHSLPQFGHLMKYGEAEGSYYIMDPDFIHMDYTDSYDSCSLWD